MRNEPIRVMCVDDNELVAEGLRIKLSMGGSRFHYLGQLNVADELVKEAFRSRPHVVLLDIDMPGKDPFEALQELSEMFPHIRVLMLSGHVRRDLIDRAIECGAWGYVSKNEGADVIVRAIEQVADGEFALGPDVESEYRRS